MAQAACTCRFYTDRVDRTECIGRTKEEQGSERLVYRRAQVGTETSASVLGLMIDDDDGRASMAWHGILPRKEEKGRFELKGNIFIWTSCLGYLGLWTIISLIMSRPINREREVGSMSVQNHVSGHEGQDMDDRSRSPWTRERWYVRPDKR